jgi:hypothetical protein
MRFPINVIIISPMSFFDLHYEIQDFHGIFAFLSKYLLIIDSPCIILTKIIVY